MVGGDEKVPEKFAYKYELDTIVVIRPTVQGDEPFWMGKLVSLGAEPDHVGEYEVWWMESSALFGSWTLSRVHGKPLLDWVPERAIQDSVTMVKKDKKLHQKSVKLIKDYMQRWKQDWDEVVGDLEPESLPVENFMDVDS